jgi:hypothetical protein
MAFNGSIESGSDNAERITSGNQNLIRPRARTGIHWTMVLTDTKVSVNTKGQ